MKIVVFGATGTTGLMICEKALQAGHHVTAFARSPFKVTLTHPNLSVVQGEVYDPKHVEEAIKGKDAVISCVGVAFTRKPVTIYSTTARHIIDAMQQHSVRRFICVSSGGTKDGWNSRNPFFFEFVLKPLFHTLYDDMREMEKIVMATDLDWTVLRPSKLLNKPATGKVRLGVDEFSLKRGGLVSREDLANHAVLQLEQTDLIGHAVAIAD